MKLIKDISSMIIRLIITHIGMGVFGLVLFFATNMQGTNVMLWATAFSAVFFAVIVYTTMWEYGAKDKAAFDAGRISGAGKRGFVACVCAEAIWIIIALLYLTFAVFKIEASTITYVILFLFNACFTGFEVFIKNSLAADLSILTPYIVTFTYIIGSLLISAVGTFGYILGSKDLTIIPKKNVKKN